MASTRLRTRKDGTTFYEIRVRIARGSPELSTRWDVPDGWSATAIKRELAKQAAEFERQCKAGEVISRSEKKQREEAAAAEAAKILTLRQFGEQVFMPDKARRLAENSRFYYQAVLDLHIYPTLGQYRMTDITPAQLNALLLEKEKSGMSHSYLIGVYTTLHQLFKKALRIDMILINPMEKVDRPQQRKDDPAKREKIEAYTTEELQEILECLENEPLKWRAFTRLLIDTGIRKGEACALEWASVDFHSGEIVISKNLCYTKQAGVYLAAPKNGKSRKVYVGNETIRLLRELRQEQATVCISKYVFTQDGCADPMHPQSPVRYMSSFGKRYGIDGLHAHKLRHSFASVAILNGADVASVSKALGHAQISTTLDMYVESNDKAVKATSEIFRAALGKAAEG